jgi:hypothetical protein
MKIDDIVKHYMEWIKRLTERPRIHLGGLEEATKGLVSHLQEIIFKKDISRAIEAKNSMAMYAHVLVACREQGADFILRELDMCLADLDKLLRASERSNPVRSIALPRANWSVEQVIVGRITTVPTHVDFMNLSELTSLRGGYCGMVIYLMRARPSVRELSNWPDKNSVIVSAGGSDTSEEMNYAASANMLYINGASNYFEELCRLEGNIVRLLPVEAATLIENSVVKKTIPLTRGTVLHPAIEYINQVVTHPINREIGYIFLAWCVERSKAGRSVLEQLKPLISSKQYEQRVAEGRVIPRKDYSNGYKLKPPSEPIRALARFATAREKRDFNYARKVARTFPCEPLVQLLLAVLSEEGD